MRKIFALLMICALVLVTGCGSSQSDSKGGSDASVPEIKLGMITHLNATEQKMKEFYDDLIKKADINVALSTLKFYDNLSSMQMGLDSGDVDEISLYGSVGSYVIANNDKYELATESPMTKLADSFCFAVRKDDTALKDDLDKTLGEMKADGTLDKLVKDYITDVDKKNIPKVDIPHFEGAEAIKIGVTGDLPPLDFVLPDGTPAGFNTALLAEIAKRLNRNIEIVSIDSGARATALSLGQIDVVFWAVVPFGEEIPTDIDKPDSLEFSAPYFKDDVVHLKLKR